MNPLILCSILNLVTQNVTQTPLTRAHKKLLDDLKTGRPDLIIKGLRPQLDIIEVVNEPEIKLCWLIDGGQDSAYYRVNVIRLRAAKDGGARQILSTIAKYVKDAWHVGFEESPAEIEAMPGLAGPCITGKIAGNLFWRAYLRGKADEVSVSKFLIVRH